LEAPFEREGPPRRAELFFAPPFLAPVFLAPLFRPPELAALRLPDAFRLPFLAPDDFEGARDVFFRAPLLEVPLELAVEAGRLALAAPDPPNPLRALDVAPKEVLRPAGAEDCPLL
jgi:hypothetical protein